MHHCQTCLMWLDFLVTSSLMCEWFQFKYKTRFDLNNLDISHNNTTTNPCNTPLVQHFGAAASAVMAAEWVRSCWAAVCLPFLCEIVTFHPIWYWINHVCCLDWLLLFHLQTFTSKFPYNGSVCWPGENFIWFHFIVWSWHDGIFWC